MPRNKNLNLELRGYVLQHAIRQENLTAEILKLVFRILNSKPKTFSNTGSSISFQNKIDFLSDLGDLSLVDYNHFKKLLEIRNQFAHNPNCNSFISLGREKPEYVKYLLSKFANGNLDEESALCTSYTNLFKHCHRRLFQVRNHYYNKFNIEIERYQCYELLVNHFEQWVNAAKDDCEKKWKEHNLETSILIGNKVEFFIWSLDILKHKFFAEILEPELNTPKLISKIFNK